MDDWAGLLVVEHRGPNACTSVSVCSDSGRYGSCRSASPLPRPCYPIHFQHLHIAKQDVEHSLPQALVINMKRPSHANRH